MRYASDTAFDSAAVLDEPGNCLADTFKNFTGFGRQNLNYVLITRDEHIDSVDVNEAVAERSRHQAIDLCYDISGVSRSSLNNVNRDTKTTKTICIGRRYANQSYIYRNPSAVEFIRYFRQKYRRIVSNTPSQSTANILCNEKSVHFKLLADLLVGIRCHPHRQKENNNS